MTDGPLVVVTGAGGMGLAIARRLGVGRRVLLADVSVDALEACERSLTEDGFDVTTCTVDVGDPESVENLATRARELGGFTYLVHTAGVSPVQASSAQIMRVDVAGTALLLAAFAADARPGCVAVCIASMAGTMFDVPPDVAAAMATAPVAELLALPELDPSTVEPGVAYGLAKRANQLRVRAEAVAWGAKGGRVVSISPGVIQTPMGREELDGPVGDIMRDMVSGSPTARFGTPWDIAAAVAFLVSPDASFITGTDLLVDGGVIASMTGPPRR